jgi:glycosyltransferase involved in cell wall biosynthesis
MSNLSACILSYNRAEYLCAALDSILKQTVNPAEIIVFDNGSDAIVYERARAYFDRGVTWVGADVNHTFAWNFRRAVITAKSEHLLILHDDDRLCDNFVEKQMNFLFRNPNVSAVTCNGYLINQLGNRTGKLLRQDKLNPSVEFYRSPAAVAIRYASDSCLPFSPVVYKADFVRKYDLQEEFGKVMDAVLFCELAKTGTIAYQLEPLYECRIHEAQDSSFFKASELENLSDYFEHEAYGSFTERKELLAMLVRQHTSRQLLRIYNSVFPIPRLHQLLTELAGLAHRRFNFLSASSICANTLKKCINVKKGAKDRFLESAFTLQ